MQALATGRLRLEPLRVADAQGMFEVLSDLAIYRYLDYPPPSSIEHLQGVYAKLESRRSPDQSELWLNWVVRLQDEQPIGYVQATVVANTSAWVGYVLSSEYWGFGYATEATRCMVEHLTVAYGVTRFRATVEVDNRSSLRLLEKLAFRPASSEESAGHELTATERLFVLESAWARNAL